MLARSFTLLMVLAIVLSAMAAPVDVTLEQRGLFSSSKSGAAKPIAAKPKPSPKPTVTKAATTAVPVATKAATITTAAAPASTSVNLACADSGISGIFDSIGDSLGLKRSDAPACTAEERKAAKAAKAQAKKDAAAAKAAKQEEEKKAAEAAKRPVGKVTNAPSKSVSCKGKGGTTTTIPVSSIQTAVSLAQAGPLQKAGAQKFPHPFNNREGVQVDPACQGKTLEEFAVGEDMSTFQNIPSVLGNFNQFRVLITTPDATGNTIFCGVMTHGESTTGSFDKDLCTEL
ncbi:hypothetical protein PLICRDRAFT_169657 [Plicaturopsis crispa FD-325 SS-3]|nr:hypothetical protein PLICRDRAFT_169657 [Plicaturopsis crispa FD-325 SS-3]